MLEGGSSHGVDKTFAYYNVKVSNNLTTDTNEVRKDEGGVKASSVIVETKNFEPRMLKEGKAMAMHRSFSCARSLASVRQCVRWT